MRKRIAGETENQSNWHAEACCGEGPSQDGRDECKLTSSEVVADISASTVVAVEVKVTAR